MSTDHLAFVDVGTAKIRTIVAEAEDRTARIIGTGNVTSRGIKNGMIVDVNEATSSIADSVQQACGDSSTKIQRTVVGFSGKHIGSTNPTVSVDTDRKSRMVTESAIREAEKQIESLTLPEDRIKVNMVIREFAVDRLQGIKNPLGMRGFRLDLDAHLVTAEAACLQNVALCVRRAGLPLMAGSFVANPLSCSESVLEPEDRDSGVILADIGAATTGIAVFKNGSICHTSALPVGGRHVTSDLAAALNIPFSTAEKLKTSCGNLYEDGGADKLAAEVLSQYNTTPEQVRYIIRARIEEILRMILCRAPYQPNNLVLTGGGASLPGIETFAEEVLGLRARVGLPKAMPEDSAELNHPAWAAGTGLLLWGTGATRIEANHDDDLEENEVGPERLVKPIIAGLSELRDGLNTLWYRRPRIVFGPPNMPQEDQNDRGE